MPQALTPTATDHPEVLVVGRDAPVYENPKGITLQAKQIERRPD
jgi:hypothetical protein